MITAGLIFHSTCSDNLGVGALTSAQVEILRAIARRRDIALRIRILDWRQTRPPYVTGPDIEIHEITGKVLVNPGGYFRLVRGCDFVVDIGAGDSFADIYGSRRLMRMFWMKYLVHMARRPLVLAPQTYGPFSEARSIRLARGTIRRSALVASRDAKSTAAARDLVPGLDVIEASDVALKLPYEPPNRQAGAGRPRIGVNVSGLLMSGGYTGANMFGLKMDYGAMMRQLIDRLLAHPEAPEVHIVPHVAGAPEGAGPEGAPRDGISAIEDDRDAALALKADRPGLIIAPPFADPQAAKTYIAGLDFFTGARMHACIAAFSSGVPVVPMAYSRKFEGLFGTLGYGRTVDCTAEDATAVTDRIVAGFEARETLKAEMAPALALGLEKLGRYEDALETVMAAAAGR